MKNEPINYNNRLPLSGYLALALPATIISLGLSVRTYWQVDLTWDESLPLVAAGWFFVLSAHLLPAICRNEPLRIRLIAWLLWVPCMLLVANNHATFFLQLRQHAGQSRVASILRASKPQTGIRSLAEILTEQRMAKTELAVAGETKCIKRCDLLRIKVISLKGQLDVLDAEADASKRSLAEGARTDLIVQSLRDDPVTGHLADWSGVDVAHLDLLLVGLFVTVLEGVACLCWSLAFRQRNRDVTTLVMPEVSEVIGSQDDIDMRAVDPMSEQEVKVNKLVEDVRVGRLKLTVEEVRKHFGCAQKTAAELRRLAEAKLNAPDFAG